MPPESLWVQYSLIGILILAASAIAWGLYRLWKDLLTWLTLQDDKREAEREKQRLWEAEQNKIRDERWQEFLKAMQVVWIQQDIRHTATQDALVNRVDLLITAVNNHDTWARAKDQAR